MAGPLPVETAPAASAHPFIVAITGGTGFIGGAVLRLLLQGNVKVRALVRSASRAACFQAPGLTWIEGELSDPSSLQRLVEGATDVIHCAGSVRGRIFADFAAANVAGLEQIVHIAGQKRRRFLLLSSLAAREPQLSAYAASKRRGEQILEEQGGKLDWVILRPPAVYGPGDRELLPLFQWLRRGILFAPGAIQGRFSLIFVADLAQAVLACLQGRVAGNSCYELHDGRARGYSWEEVRKIAAELYQRSVRRVPIPEVLLRAAAHSNSAVARLIGYPPMLTPGKVREIYHADWVCDNQRLYSATCWRPTIELPEGLRLTLGC